MSNGTWTDIENDLIVADYFAMLADDVFGRSYSKAEHRRALLPLLNNRSEGSVEFKLWRGPSFWTARRQVLDEKIPAV